MSDGIQERRSDVSGLPNRWLERGDEGMSVTFVHGIPTSAELWRHVMQLVSGARLLAWEMPGYGRSWQVPPELDISVAAQVKHLLAWLDRIGVERTVLAATTSAAAWSRSRRPRCPTAAPGSSSRTRSPTTRGRYSR